MLESGELGFRKLPVEDTPKKRAFRLLENFRMLDFNGVMESTRTSFGTLKTFC